MFGLDVLNSILVNPGGGEVCTLYIVPKQSYTYHFWSQVLYIVSLRAKGLAKKAGREEAGSGGGTKRDKNTDGSLEWTTNQ